MSDIFAVTVDKVAFKKDVEDLLAGTELWKMVQEGLKFSWGTKRESVLQVVNLARHIVAAIEIVKTRILAKYSDPSKKFDTHLALDTAVAILDDTVIFTGLVGSVVDRFDRPVLEMVIEGVLAGYRGSQWLSVAKALLGLV